MTILGEDSCDPDDPERKRFGDRNPYLQQIAWCVWFLNREHGGSPLEYADRVKAVFGMIHS